MVLIITGHQRSGTTLLLELCNSHPDISLTMEFGNFCSIGKPYIVYMSRMIKRWLGIGIRYWPLVVTQAGVFTSIVKRQKRMTIARNHAFVLHYLFKMLRHWQRRVNVQAIEATLKNIFPGKRIVGDKYPDYVFELSELAGADNLSILVICRDCRDVTSSALRTVSTAWRNMPVLRKKMDTAEKIAERWVQAIELMDRHRDKLCVIHYEDLIKEKERELKALGNWLGVDPAGFNAEVIRDNTIGKYKNGLSDIDLMTVMDVAGPTMAKMGYL
ncbi:MAG: sulfotransferase [Deltaproteobacteria bacterium]|nr:sulfotransferase [Deltaproteobacteria bacterium]